MLSRVPRLSREMVDAARLQRGLCPLEPGILALSEPHYRRRAQRETNDMLEDRPISVPTNPGADILPDQKGLLQCVGGKIGIGRRAVPNRFQLERFPFSPGHSRKN